MSKELTIPLWVTLLMLVPRVRYILAELNKHSVVETLGYISGIRVPHDYLRNRLGGGNRLSLRRDGGPEAARESMTWQARSS